MQGNTRALANQLLNGLFSFEYEEAGYEQSALVKVCGLIRRRCLDNNNIL